MSVLETAPQSKETMERPLMISARALCALSFLGFLGAGCEVVDRSDVRPAALSVQANDGTRVPRSLGDEAMGNLGRFKWGDEYECELRIPLRLRLVDVFETPPATPAQASIDPNLLELELRTVGPRSKRHNFPKRDYGLYANPIP